MGNICKTLNNLIKIATLALVAAAIYQELKKPKSEREWHGKIADFIPYDFRLPTGEKLRQRFWNPEDPRILTEHVFGVGWAINFYTVLERLERLKKEPSSPTSEGTEA